MSLTAIRDMRIKRVKPANLVTVIVGTAPALWRGDNEVIELPSGSQPSLMDWRPVVGLWTVFYMIKPDWFVMDAAVECASKAGAKLFGFVHAGQAHSLAKFSDADDERQAKLMMWNQWSGLCK